MSQSVSATLYPSAARTATPTAVEITSDIFNEYESLEVYVNCTAIVTAPSVTFAIETFDTASGAWFPVLTSAAVTGAGKTTMRLGPHFPNVANVSQSGIVGPRLRVAPTHGNADSITYSVGIRLA